MNCSIDDAVGRLDPEMPHALQKSAGDALQVGQRYVLELIATGKPLREVLETLVFFIEGLVPGQQGVVLLKDTDEVLRPAARGRMPGEAVEALDGVSLAYFEEIFAHGSHPKERMVVADLRMEKRWGGRRDVLRKHRLSVGWAVPVFSKDQSLSGIFLLFQNEVRRVSEQDYSMLETTTHLAGVAIDRDRAERALREAKDQLEQRVAERTAELVQANRQLRDEIRERKEAESALRRSEALLAEAERIAHLGSLRWDIGSDRCIWSDEACRIFGLAPEEVGTGYTAILDRLDLADRGHIQRFIEAVTETEVPDRIEGHVVRPDGEERVVDLRARVKRDERGAAKQLVCVVHDVTDQRTLERELVKAAERERQRVGRDLHDGLGQLLTGVAYLSKTLSARLASASAPQAGDAAEITELVELAIEQARGLSKMLLPVELEENGLEAALRRLAGDVDRVYQLDCVFESEKDVQVRDKETALHIYRIAQEAVHNAVRHSRGSRVKVVLSLDDRSINLTIRDNGIGLPKNGRRRGGGLGLRSMRHRAQIIGASLTVDRMPGGGTEVICVLPRL